MLDFRKEFTETEQVLNQLASPRLQIIGCMDAHNSETCQRWDYELVYEHFTEGYETVKMGQQMRLGGNIETNFKDENGLIDPPMRIKADSKWDSIKMNLPLYYVWDKDVEKVDLTQFKEMFKDRLSK